MTASPSAFSIWMLAIRPRTLSLSVVPVVVGAGLAWTLAGVVELTSLLSALVGAVCIQIATNLHNDAGDFERGADGDDRLGPPRVTALGLLSARTVKRAAWGFFALAALAGLYLVDVGGWPILALGVCSILAGWSYTGGPKPIAYTPLGELFVLVFFGLGAVGGTVWLQGGTLGPEVLTAGLALGLFAAAVLLLNNHRDAEIDARNGRRTLAILVGHKGAGRLYAVFMLLPFLLLGPLHWLMPEAQVWLAVGALPLAWILVKRFPQAEGREFNFLLARTAQTQLLFGLLLAFGLVMS